MSDQEIEDADRLSAQAVKEMLQAANAIYPDGLSPAMVSFLGMELLQCGARLLLAIDHDEETLQVAWTTAKDIAHRYHRKARGTTQ